MIIIRNELSEMKKAPVAKCEQCKKKKRGRYVRVGKQILGGGDRGNYFFCYDCFGPKLIWKKNEGGQTYESPAETK